MYRWVSSRLLAALLTLAVTLAGAVGLLIVHEQREASAVEDARATAAEQARETWQADLARAKEEQAERKRIAAENAATREEASKELAAQRQAEEQAAARRAAKLAQQRAKAAAERAARLAEEKRLAEERKKRHVVQGTVLVPDVRGALVIRVGGRPGQSVSDLTDKQRSQLDWTMKRIEGGASYGCAAGSGGRWSDVHTGAQVTIEDGEGALLAKGTLGGGTLTADGCRFTFAIEVGYADNYRVRVTQRGPATWTRDELVAQGWRVALTL